MNGMQDLVACEYRRFFSQLAIPSEEERMLYTQARDIAIYDKGFGKREVEDWWRTIQQNRFPFL